MSKRFKPGARVLIRRALWRLVPDSTRLSGTVVWDEGDEVVNVRLDSVPDDTEIIPFRFGEGGYAHTAVQRWQLTPLDAVTDLGLILSERELDG